MSRKLSSSLDEFQSYQNAVLMSQKQAAVEKIYRPCLEVIKLEYSLRLKIKCNDWLLADTCPQAAKHFGLF